MQLPLRYTLALLTLTLALASAPQSPGADASAPTTTPPANPASRTNLFADEIVVSGQGFVIHRSQVEDAFTALKATVASQGKSIPEAQRAEVEGQLLEDLINVQLLLGRATEEDKAKGQTEGEKRLSEYRASWSSEEGFKRQLLAWGMPLDQFRKRLVEKAVFLAVIEREVKNTIQISTNQVRDYYRDNPKQFDQPEKVRVAQVFFLTQDPQTKQPLPDADRLAKLKTAEKVLSLARAGEDFARLARDYSDDLATKEKGGEVGWVSHGQMLPEIETAALALSANQLSDIVTTKFGYHLLKALEKRPARTLTLEEVEKDLTNYLIDQEMKKQLPVYLKKLRDAAGVRYHRPSA